METNPTPKHLGPKLNLQVTPSENGITVMFSAAEEKYPSVFEAREHYEHEIKSTKKKIRELYSVIILATGFQIYQIAQGIHEEDLSALIPIAVVATLMLYLRRQSLQPALEHREVVRKKSELLQRYQENMQTSSEESYLQ